MHLELNQHALEAVTELVAQAIRESGPEIHHTDTRQYRAELQKRREALEHLSARLDVGRAIAAPTTR